MMQVFLNAFDSTIAALRVGLLGVATVLAALCAVDWMVRTRRLSPFSPIARFMRGSVDPLLKPVERRVVRAGGLPSSAPWWALGGVVLGGILLLWLLEFVRSQVAFLYVSVHERTRRDRQAGDRLGFYGVAARADRARTPLVDSDAAGCLVLALVLRAHRTDPQAAAARHPDDRDDGHHADRRVVPAGAVAGIHHAPGMTLATGDPQPFPDVREPRILALAPRMSDP